MLFQGPTNPNVFQSPDPDKGLNLTEEERARVQALKDSIIKVMEYTHKGVCVLFILLSFYYLPLLIPFYVSLNFVLYDDFREWVGWGL